MSALAVSKFLCDQIESYCNAKNEGQDVPRIQQYTTSFSSVNTMRYVPKIQTLGSQPLVIVLQMTDSEVPQAFHRQCVTYTIDLALHASTTDENVGGDDFKTFYGLVKKATRNIVVNTEITDTATGETTVIQEAGREMVGNIMEPQESQVAGGQVHFIGQLRVTIKEGIPT